MHSPTLILLASIFSVLVTLVLYAVWYFNRHIPGLRLWVFSLLSTSVYCGNLLVRGPVPEVVSVVLAQVAIALTGYLCWLGSRAYVGRAPAGSSRAGWPENERVIIKARRRIALIPAGYTQNRHRIEGLAGQGLGAQLRGQPGIGRCYCFNS